MSDVRATLNTTKVRVFIYKCTNCHTPNETQIPPSDNVMECKKCGYPTVQYFDRVKTVRR